MEWGSIPEFFGPRHYYRESILLKEIKNNLKMGEILDVGFGNGSLSMRTSKEGYNIKGIELSNKFIEHVSEKIKNFPNILVISPFLTSIFGKF
jgi:2-polyprenyl-3-methyl-5-hydroxy-6-metoxy-1,4-benzoquinol methylase